MLAAWSLAAFRYRPDVIIVGTDPILSLLVALPWKLVRPKVRIAHWCFDLYPEAAVADGLLRPDSWIVRRLKALMRAAYGKCDLLVDIGMCMGRRIHQYRPSGSCATLTPWALEEPSAPLPVDAAERSAEFGDAGLTLLYSGNFGRAHAYERVLSLARLLRDQNVAFAFSVRGNAEDRLRSAVTPSDTNIRFLSFVSQSQLQARLSAADIHIVTLRDEWTGAVVPSKFFGALAAGRPVLFEGSPDCAIAEWIRKFRVGWVLTEGSEETVAAEIAQLCRERAGFEELFQRCHDTYAKAFSKRIVIDAWDRELRALP
jgi:glycosyltransferase involved in cell wall biosynthesis